MLKTYEHTLKTHTKKTPFRHPPERRYTVCIRVQLDLRTDDTIPRTIEITPAIAAAICDSVEVDVTAAAEDAPVAVKLARAVSIFDQSILPFC